MDTSLLERVASCLADPVTSADGSASLLTLSASKYTSSSLDEDVTQPTGFDPQAAALFEAVVESAFLVANADGEFDAVERQAFERVVLSACKGSVSEQQIHALLADLGDLLVEDGLEKRVGMVARTITRPEQAREVLRIAGLIAHVSHGVSEVERAVLERLADQFHLDRSAVDDALVEVTRALAG